MVCNIHQNFTYARTCDMLHNHGMYPNTSISSDINKE